MLIFAYVLFWGPSCGLWDFGVSRPTGFNFSGVLESSQSFAILDGPYILGHKNQHNTLT